MAIWHHKHSTNDNPDHDLCPLGEHSWCGFQWDVARGTSEYQHNPLPEAVANAILPIFESLSDDELLACCLHGSTQNKNEAIHALICQRATKETHSGLPVVVICVMSLSRKHLLRYSSRQIWPNLEFFQEVYF